VTPEVERDVLVAEQQSLEEIDRAFADNPDDIAAILIEPIQAEGGDIHFRPEFLRALQGKARQHEAFFVLDEVQTGVGITGKMWAHEHFGLEPDAVAFGKKMQICGCMVGPRVDEEPENVFRSPRGSTPPGGAASPTWSAPAVTSRSSTRTGSSRTPGSWEAGFSTASAPSSRSWAA
jgi:4-aminobutyrate aminotransferase-like enzyme